MPYNYIFTRHALWLWCYGHKLSLICLTLSDEVLLKLLQELQVEQIIGGEGLLSYHGLHGLHVLTNGIAGILRWTKAWEEVDQDMEIQIKSNSICHISQIQQTLREMLTNKPLTNNAVKKYIY